MFGGYTTGQPQYYSLNLRCLLEDCTLYGTKVIESSTNGKYIFFDMKVVYTLQIELLKYRLTFENGCIYYDNEGKQPTNHMFFGKDCHSIIDLLTTTTIYAGIYTDIGLRKIQRHCRHITTQGKLSQIQMFLLRCIPTIQTFSLNENRINSSNHKPTFTKGILFEELSYKDYTYPKTCKEKLRDLVDDIKFRFR